VVLALGYTTLNRIQWWFTFILTYNAYQLSNYTTSSKQVRPPPVDPFILVWSYTASCLWRPTVYNSTALVRHSTRLRSGATVVHSVHCRTRTCGHTAWHASTPVCWWQPTLPSSDSQRHCSGSAVFRCVCQQRQWLDAGQQVETQSSQDRGNVARFLSATQACRHQWHSNTVDASQSRGRPKMNFPFSCNNLQ